MRVLVTGATGFIAAQVVTDLLFAGHEVTCCVRNKAHARSLFPKASILACDFINDTKTEDWDVRLKNIDIVVNCVGILYHPNKKTIWAIHYDTPKALFDACVKNHVKKIIQISALGVDKSDVAFATSKKAADDYLLTLPINSIILRPSLVYGKGSYGGTSLFRGLAGLPYLTLVPGKGNQEFQPIHLQDLSITIVKLLESTLSGSIIINAVGPQAITLKEILVKLRAWLGFLEAKLIFIPLISIRILSWLGDFIPYSAINTTSYKMLIQNNITSEAETNKFISIVGFTPRDFTTGLYSQPSTVQDHWHARLYFLKPFLQVSIAFIWIFSALCSVIFYPRTLSFDLLTQIGVTHFWQPILLYGSSILNALLGFAVLCNYKLRIVCVLQLLVILIYSAIISWKLPHLWIDPFGPVAKNIPIFVAILVLLALESDR